MLNMYRSAVAAAAVIVAVAGCGGSSAPARGSAAAVARQFTDALAAQNFGAACSLLDPAVRAQLLPVRNGLTCTQAFAVYASDWTGQSLPTVGPSLRSLRSAHERVSADGSLAEVVLSGGEAADAMGRLALSKATGRWLVVSP